jgi:hypothetical protein
MGQKRQAMTAKEIEAASVSELEERMAELNVLVNGSDRSARREWVDIVGELAWRRRTAGAS